jgi:excisionase family DNA binding protein
MNVSEAARLLEVKPATVYSLCAAGLLAHRRVGLGRGVIRITREALDAYIASCSVATRAPSPKVIPAGTGLAFRSITGEMMAEERRKAGSDGRRRTGGPS